MRQKKIFACFELTCPFLYVKNMLQHMHAHVDLCCMMLAGADVPRS